LLAVTNKRPDQVLVSPPTRTANPIARAFTGYNTSVFTFLNPRRVTAGKAEGMPVKVDPILVTGTRPPVWEEANLTTDSAELFATYTAPGTPEDKRPNVLGPTPVAVA